MCPRRLRTASRSRFAQQAVLKIMNERDYEQNEPTQFPRLGMAIAATATAAAPSGRAQGRVTKKVIYPNGNKLEKTPLFSSTIVYGNLVFVAGVGNHEEGDIKAHTRHVLDQIKQQLESAGSSMQKVLKCTVFLSDMKDYAAMNEVFQGSFGDEPPVRTTVAAARLPGANSLIEIDVIAGL